jgi:hypothetical protein
MISNLSPLSPTNLPTPRFHKPGLEKHSLSRLFPSQSGTYLETVKVYAVTRAAYQLALSASARILPPLIRLRCCAPVASGIRCLLRVRKDFTIDKMIWLTI